MGFLHEKTLLTQAGAAQRVKNEGLTALHCILLYV